MQAGGMSTSVQCVFLLPHAAPCPAILLQFHSAISELSILPVPHLCPQTGGCLLLRGS